MPLPTKWSKFKQENLDKIASVFGVYELADKNKNVIYIGQGVLSDRLQQHKCNYKSARFFRAQKTGSKSRAEQRERAELNTFEKRHGKLPRRNKKHENPPKKEWWEKIL